MTSPRVYIASPFNGSTVEETRQNIIYARLCMKDSLERGESPYLSHLLITQVFAETPELREAGLRAGDAWREAADIVAVYTDLGVTPGMQRALSKAKDGTCVGRTLKRPRLHSVKDWRDVLSLMELETFPALLRECPACKGTGDYWQEHDYGARENLGCPDCRGTGRVPSAKPAELVRERAESP